MPYSFANFIDLDYVIKDNKTYIRFLLKKDDELFYQFFQYDPYFYVDTENKKLLESLEFSNFVKRIELVERKVGLKRKKIMKVYCHKPKDVKILKRNLPFPCYEYDIPFRKRAVIDLRLEPFCFIEYVYEGNEIKKILSTSPSSGIDLRCISFDIETYNKFLTSNPKKDPIILISTYDGKDPQLFTFSKNKRKDVIVSKDEKEMLLNFFEFLTSKQPHVLFGYNSTNFDLPYIKERCKRLKLNLLIGDNNKYKTLRRGRINGLKLDKIVHIDLYPVSLFFSNIGAIKTSRYTLDEVAGAVLGEHKFSLDKSNIWQLWEEDKDSVYEYSKQDAVVTYDLGMNYLPLLKEISVVSKTPLFEASLSTTSQLVENYLMFFSDSIIPSKPIFPDKLSKYKGAYVKVPEPGIYENLVVFDFRSLYPSIIISYNIDPYTLDENGEYISPTGARFLKKPIGLIPRVLRELVNLRSKLKRRLKSLDKNSEEYLKLYPRVQALKILANSFYGSMGYPRSRWYNKTCAESVTAWARKHIKEAERIAEARGFKVLYIDTDSLFLLLGNKSKKEAMDLLDEINLSLPEYMELELESFYKRAVFVSKRSDQVGAKKKYALLDEKGRIKIKGFELVRRDWSNIAKKTQRKVLEIILKEGDKDKAVSVVKDVIKKLREGKVDLKDLVIYTHLTKDLTKYAVKSPELVAAKKAIKRGVPLEEGYLIGYVITKNGRSISDKAEYYKFAKNYDAEYYINHQVLPAVMKILKELNYDFNLNNKSNQKGLMDFE